MRTMTGCGDLLSCHALPVSAECENASVNVYVRRRQMGWDGNFPKCY